MAPFAILLTAGRGALIGGVVALSIVPLNLISRASFSTWLRLAVVLFVAAVTIGVLVPRQTWDRLLTTKQEIEGGTIGGRSEIWMVGWQVFQERPLLGAGTGTFQVAVEPLYFRATAHNMPLALLVEQGIVGFGLFASLLGACAWTIVGLQSGDRKLWGVLILTLLIFSMSGDSHTEKLTWLLFGLLAAQEAVTTRGRQSLEPRPGRADGAALLNSIG